MKIGINDQKNTLLSKPNTNLENFVQVRKGDIFYANLSPVIGSEQGGIRPVVIIQNNIGNKFSPTVIVAAITSHQKNKLPTHISIKASKISGLPRDSVILLEQIRTLDKTRLISKMGVVNSDIIQIIDRALIVSLGLTLIPGSLNIT